LIPLKAPDNQKKALLLLLRDIPSLNIVVRGGLEAFRCGSLQTQAKVGVQQGWTYRLQGLKGGSL